MEHPCYRNELKYIITPQSRVILSRRLGQVLQRDPHALGIGYTIKSLYFDTADDQALRDNLMGAACREKFRIRSYNDDLTFIRLEKKVKRLDQGYKISAPLSSWEVDGILQGDYDFLKTRPEDLMQEFYCKLKSSLLKPCLIVTYFREPFLYRPGNVRVTLDYDLRYSRAMGRFLKGDEVSIRDRSGKCLLEVKYDAFLPDIIRLLLSGQDPLRTAHSKYVTGRFVTGA